MDGAWGWGLVASVVMLCDHHTMPHVAWGNGVTTRWENFRPSLQRCALCLYIRMLGSVWHKG